MIAAVSFDPARIISDRLDIRKSVSLQVDYYSGVNQKLDIQSQISLNLMN